MAMRAANSSTMSERFMVLILGSMISQIDHDLFVATTTMTPRNTEVYVGARAYILGKKSPNIA
jgi:uncharacterized protein YdeI (BOF family)